MRQQVGDETRGIDALHAFAGIARHRALVGQDGLGEMFEPITLHLAQPDELGALRLGNAADGEALQQTFHAGHRRLELVAGELQQLLHVFALLLAALREQEQHHQAAGQQQRQQRRFTHQHDVAPVVMLGDLLLPLLHLLRA